MSKKPDHEKNPAAVAMGKLGGEAVKTKYGKEFYQAIGSKGGKETAKKGPEFFTAIGAKGGATNKDRHGKEHYQRIGKIGGKRVQELMAAGKAVIDAKEGKP